MIGAVAIIFIGTWMSAFGALSLKRGAERFSFHPAKLIKNYYFILGGCIYVASIPVYLAALQQLPLSVAYPMTSMTYIWSTLLAKTYLNEEINIWRWTGIFLIVVGITVVSI